MNRFFVPRELIKSPEFCVTDKDDVRHLVGALRVAPGERLFISDGDGGGCLAKVVRADRRKVVFSVTEEFRRVRREEQRVRVTIACAIPKFARFEEIVDYGTQLGAEEIVPLVTERTLVGKDDFDRKLSRLKRVALSAAKQSGALFLPVLREAVEFREFLKGASGYALKLIPNLSATSASFRKAVEEFGGGRALILIGPEGDFTKEETEAALALGFRGVTLGASVLRVDAAAVCVTSFLRLYFDL